MYSDIHQDRGQNLTFRMKLLAVIFYYFLFLNENDASSYVPPVENVTVVCHNQQPVVYWNHSQPELQPRFSVTLKPYYGRATQVCTNTSDYHCNVFAGSKVPIDDDYKVTVNVISQNESVTTSSVMFTYDVRSPLSPCSVDLPSANISIQPDHQIKVHFLHPYLVYGDVFQLSGKVYRTFHYSIITKDQTKHAFSCHMRDRVCEASLAIGEEAATHCVNIQGRLHVLTVSAPEHICMENPPPGTSAQRIVIYCLVPVAFVIMVVIVLYLFINWWTNHSRTLPSSLNSVKWLHQQVRGHPLRPEETSPSPVSETPTSDDTRRLFSPERCTSNPDPAPLNPAPLEQTHFPIARPAPQSGGGAGMSAPGEELDCTLVDCVAEGDDGAWDSGSSGALAGSGYEKHVSVVSLEMDSGDTVMGYK